MSTQKLPNPFTWKYVLVHKFYRNADARIISNYNGTTTSFMSLHRGTAKPTFVTDDIYMMQRYIKLGWDDITDEVRAIALEHWDKLHMSWKLDDKGLLPWEKEPKSQRQERVGEIVVEQGKDQFHDEVKLDAQDDRPLKSKPTPRGVATRKPRPKPKSKKG